jgi:hypothetical protein
MSPFLVDRTRPVEVLAEERDDPAVGVLGARYSARNGEYFVIAPSRPGGRLKNEWPASG